MMETQNYWEDTSAHAMQVKYESLDGRSCKDEIYRMGIGAGYCEGNLNFATASEDDEVYTKKKVSRELPARSLARRKYFLATVECSGEAYSSLTLFKTS